MKILVANLGSTSFKYRLFDMANGEKLLARGGVERIGHALGRAGQGEALQPFPQDIGEMRGVPARCTELQDEAGLVTVFVRERKFQSQHSLSSRREPSAQLNYQMMYAEKEPIRFAHRREIRSARQQHLQTCADDGMVIHNEHPDGVHSSLYSGTLMLRTVLP